MKIAYILIGPSGAGKSTTVAELKVEHEGQKVGVFSLDTCRQYFYGLKDSSIMAGKPLISNMVFNPPTDKEAAAEFYSESFDYANSKGKEFDDFVTANWIDIRNSNDVVIVDNTNSSKKSRTRWVNDLRNSRTSDFHIVMVEFQLPIQTVAARQQTRADKSVPIGSVNQQYFRQEAALLGSECDEVRVIHGAVEGDDNHMKGALKHYNRYVQSQADKQAAKAAEKAAK